VEEESGKEDVAEESDDEVVSELDDMLFDLGRGMITDLRDGLEFLIVDGVAVVGTEEDAGKTAVPFAFSLSPEVDLSVSILSSAI
jgi:hypothetical protein